MKYHDIKNKKGTSLLLGVHPKGLYIFRLTNIRTPVVGRGAESGDGRATHGRPNLMLPPPSTPAPGLLLLGRVQRAGVCGQKVHHSGP